MKKKTAGFKLDDETIKLIEELSNRTGKTKSNIVYEAVRLYAEQDKIQNTELELLQEENFKLKQAITEFHRLINLKDEIISGRDKIIAEKDKIIALEEQLIKEKDNLIAEKERLIREKEELIKQKEALIEQKEKAIQDRNELIKKLKEKKSFWQRLFGG